MSDSAATNADPFLPPATEKPRSQRDDVVMRLRLFAKGLDSVDLVHGTLGDFWVISADMTTHNLYTILMEIMEKLPLDKAAKDEIWILYHHLCRCIDAPPEF